MKILAIETPSRGRGGAKWPIPGLPTLNIGLEHLALAQCRVMEDHFGGNTAVPRNMVILQMTRAGHDFIDGIRR